jgi:hypothetical protein
MRFVIGDVQTLQEFPRPLPTGGPYSVRSDLLRLELSLDSDDFDLDFIKPLLNAALADHPDDALIGDRVYDAITESTPPP